MTIKFDSFTSEPGKPDRRPRPGAAALVGATMLVAAAGGIGFGIGQAAGGDVALSPADAPDTPETVAPVPEPPAAVASTEPAAEEPTGRAESGVATDEPATTDGLGVVTVDITSDDFAAPGGGEWTVFGGEPMTLLAERTTRSGALLRAHLGQLWDQEMYGDFGPDGPDGWQPPAWCFESGQVRVALGGAESTGPSVIDVGSVSWWSEPFNGRAVSALTMGLVDGNPYRVVFVQAPPSVTNVTVVFGDGATDSVTPTDGVAMLTVPGSETSPDVELGWTPPPIDFEVTFEQATGETVSVPGDRLGYADPEFQASCSPPPPALPDPGEQPGDPAAEEQTIIDLMTAIYLDDEGPNDDWFDDPTGIAEARQEIRSGSFEEAAANAEAIVEELVFTSRTEAWFRYRIETTTGTFAGRFGIAVNNEETWKITRNTICQDLALAGGSCGGFIDNIRPPGS